MFICFNQIKFICDWKEKMDLEAEALARKQIASKIAFFLMMDSLGSVCFVLLLRVA